MYEALSIYKLFKQVTMYWSLKKHTEYTFFWMKFNCQTIIIQILKHRGTSDKYLSTVS